LLPARLASETPKEDIGNLGRKFSFAMVQVRTSVPRVAGASYPGDSQVWPTWDDDKMSTTVHNVRMSPDKTVRRLKTYAGTQGYVYQYYFVGERAALANDPEAPAKEFVFDVTSDRKLTYAVSVFLPEESVTTWTKVHNRPLTDAEQYAAAKLRLFRAFDELEDVKAHGRRLLVHAAGLEEALASLGVE